MKKIFILLINILFITEVKAESLKYINCGAFEMPTGIANIINIIVNIVYLGVPLILILSGSIDFSKATVAKDKKAIESFRPKFLNRLKSGTIVFLIFSLVKILVSVVSNTTGSDINQCLECLVNHNSCGGEVESPHKIEIPQDQEFFVPDFKGPTLDEDSYEKEKEKYGNKGTGFIDHNGINYDNTVLPNNNNNSNFSKTLFVGDSRTEGMCGSTGTTGCKYSTNGGAGLCGGSAIACRSMGYDWFNSTAISQINSKVSGGGYNIVLWWGVNDLHNLSKYVTKFTELADSTWKNNQLVIVTVGPIQAADTYTTQSEIDDFNAELKNKLNANKKSNISICDIASGVTISKDSDYDDKLHYNKAGYQKIYDYIKGNCL